MMRKNLVCAFIIIIGIGHVRASTSYEPLSTHNGYEQEYDLSTYYACFSAGLLLNLATHSKIVRLCALYPIVYCGKVLLDHKEIVKADIQAWYSIARSRLKDFQDEPTK